MKHAILAAALVLAALPAPARAHGPDGHRETSTPIFRHDLPNVPGKAMVAVEVVYPPGATSPPHTHPQSGFIYAYVVSGAVASAVGDEAPRVYKAGEGWHELPGARHSVSRNASDTEPATLLAVFVLDAAERQLVLPDAQ